MHFSRDRRESINPAINIAINERMMGAACRQCVDPGPSTGVWVEEMPTVLGHRSCYERGESGSERVWLYAIRVVFAFKLTADASVFHSCVRVCHPTRTVQSLPSTLRVMCRLLHPGQLCDHHVRCHSAHDIQKRPQLAQGHREGVRDDSHRPVR